MTSPAKLYAKLLTDSGATIRFRDFERLLIAFGLVHKRTSGSHRQYRHPLVPRVIPVQPSGGDAKRYQVRDFMLLVERYGLEIYE